MWKGLASNALTLFVVILFLGGGLIGWGVKEYAAPGPLQAAVCLRVEPGSNMSRVSENLADLGAVSSQLVFNLGVNYADKAGQLKAGSFLVPEGASMEEIVGLVTGSGNSTCGTEIVWQAGINRMLIRVSTLDPATRQFVEVASFDPAADEVPEAFNQYEAESDTRLRVVVSEGLTSWMVVERLKEISVLAGEVDQVPPEGMLAPGDYPVRRGEDRGELLGEMLSLQQEILSRAWAERAEDLPYQSANEALIMASIVEKETGVDSERPQVASVFLNRLRQGIPLQTDPTVIYGITNGEGVLGRGLRQSELRAETPYNTYVIRGLPPGPIANPGRAAIEATLNPADTDYIFFVAATLNPADGHVFAVTLDEHNANVANYRRLEAEAAAGGN